MSFRRGYLRQLQRFCFTSVVLGLGAFACSDQSPGSDAAFAAEQGAPDASPERRISDGATAEAGHPQLDATVDQAPTDRSAASDRGHDQVAVDLRLVEVGSTGDRGGEGSYDGVVPQDPGPVQCRKDEDCGADLSCNRSAPGGICQGCGASCPGGLSCMIGACVRDCQRDSDCNRGFRCSAQGLCLLRRCSVQEPCPAPYACGDTGLCSRPACDDTTPCPQPLRCDTGRCVE